MIHDPLLNVEFEWERNSLELEEPLQGLCIYGSELIRIAVDKKKIGRAAVYSEVGAEMVEAAGWYSSK